MIVYVSVRTAVLLLVRPATSENVQPNIQKPLSAPGSVCGRLCPADYGGTAPDLVARFRSGRAATLDFIIIFTLQVVFKAHPNLNPNPTLIRGLKAKPSL